jgi:CBS domain-containing protein
MSHSALLTHPRSQTSIGEVMRSGVISIPQDASLRRVADAMATHRIHAVLVMGRDGAGPIGWVTSRSLLERAARDPELTFARDAIDEPPAFISPGASVASAVEQLLAGGTTHLIVSIRPQDPPEGVVTALDIVALLFDGR